MIPTTTAPRGLLAGSCALGVLSALWALFQWAELLIARAGGTPFCAVNETFNCRQVWDSGFAAAVHDVTFVPVAGWGLMWALVATALPLMALANDAWLPRGLSAALRLTGLAGVFSTVVLGAASFASGAVCIACLGTYAIVIVWAGLTWRATRSSAFGEPVKGVALAAGAVVVSYLALLYPGIETPHKGKDALNLGATPPAASTQPAGASSAATGPSPFDGPATGDPARDDLLQRFVTSLGAQERQTMSDLLADYGKRAPVVLGAPRALSMGTAEAPLRVTEWTDARCPHCAMLHGTLQEIASVTPPGLFSVEPRQFPLDGACNPGVQRKTPDAIRCQAALAEICLEGNAREFEATGKIFAEENLTAETLMAALKPFSDVNKIKACMQSPAAQKHLQSDIEAAMALNIEGTPMVLLNGRQAQPFGPLLYALILTGGVPKHPAFAQLPPPRALPPGDDGHGHEH